MRQIHHNALALLKAVPHGYATIMFSDSVLIGLSMLVLTMVSPVVGLSGLLGLVVGLLASRLTGFESWDSSSGVYSFNSLLVGLTIGYYYPYPGCLQQPLLFVGLVITGALLVQILYIGLNHLTQQWFKIPSMSLAFSIASVFIWYLMVRSGYFTGYGFQKPLLIDLKLALPRYWSDFFLAMGSIMFVPDILVGIAMALVMLFISRIATLLALVGWSICFFLIQYSHMGATYGMFFPGFNLILVSMAIGSVFLIPGKSSYLLAVLGTVFAFLVAYALSGKYYYPDIMPSRPDVLYVPMFAFPMNLVVISMVFALRLRLRQSSPIINDYGILHPEKALDAYLSRYRRFQSAGIPQIYMPVSGQWLITQGHNGPHTHRKDWAYAWDFEIVDDKGRKYSDTETSLRDYYCFGKPVYAAAAGEVVKVVNSIPDNPIGGMNTRDNWGNYVTIDHGLGYYTLYAHLKEDSVKLSEGDKVKQGERIGLVGNSGRSPFPHLHFQAQMGVDAGSKTIFSHLINFKRLKEDGSLEFVSSGVPEEGDLISPLVPENDLAPILQMGYGQEQSFRVSGSRGEWEENWKVEVDLYGLHTLVSDRGSRLDFSIYKGIFNSLNLSHMRGTALEAFAMATSRLPWVEDQNLIWEDEPALSVVMNPFFKNLTLFFIPFFQPIRVQTCSRLTKDKDALRLESETSFCLLGIRISQHIGTVTLSRLEGITGIALERNGRSVLRAKRIFNNTGDMENDQK
jgi:urea transporter